MTTRELALELENRELAQSRLRYADLFDFAPIGYATLDSSACIEEVNLAGARLLGGTPQQFIGQRFDDFVQPQDEQRFHDHIEQSRAVGHRLRTELQLMPRDGTPITVELYTVASHEMEQGRLQFRCAILNITDRRQAEEALHRSEVELELRAKHHFLSEVSAVFSASLNYETVLENIVRMSIPRLADCCVVDLVQPDGSLVRSAVAHIDRNKEPLLWELGRLAGDSNEAFGKAKVIRTARSELYADISPSLMMAIARGSEHLRLLQELGFKSYICVPLVVRGRAIGAVGVMRVQTGPHYTLFDLALAEEFADRAAMALDNALLFSKEQEANQFKDDFLAIVSHELRTPLTPIIGAVYRLRSIRQDDPEVQAMADVVERNAKAQSRIVEDLLDISRVASGKFELTRQPADLGPIIETAIEVARPAAEALGITVDVDIDELRRPIWCDAPRIQQAMWNLLSNAIKFSNPGGQIRVAAHYTPSQTIRISVSDEGVGIPKDFLPHVFEPFRQPTHFSTRAHGGLGLGLSMVQHIVRQHGGTVRAESDGEGKGATFVVELPCSR